ncbi:MAG: FAD-binding oxidoreductase [Gammaproteobacteria bacterium]|jgi:FAD/FMN-containing dehydrogenase|nr:FAD-binding oxidoreductase [Gammaproteobacteria bacterium]
MPSTPSFTSATAPQDAWREVTRRPRRRPAAPPPASVIAIQPRSADDIAAILLDTRRYPSPVRPVGSGSSTTRAHQTAAGTLMDMTALDRILGTTRDSVTVQAGVRFHQLADHLAADGMELAGGCAAPNRTVGGAISSATLAGALPGDGGQLASSVLRLTLINSKGRRVEVSERLPDLLRLVRMSYGLLGVVYAVTLRIRPIRPYTVRKSRYEFAELTDLLPTLLDAEAAVRASLLPFRDRVYLEQRYPAAGDGRTALFSWKLRDWANNSALPRMARSVSRAVPVRQLRDPLIDGVTEATSALVNNRFVESGSNAAEQSGRFKRLVLDSEVVNCVWMFPAARFVPALRTWQKFCVRHYRTTGFRCDLPAEFWRIDRDRYSLLSPSHDGTVFALNIRSTRHPGWDNFMLECAEFAAHFRGIPVFNQTLSCKASDARRAYGERLERFRAMRQRLDPADRLLNQYFAERIG